MIHCTSTTLAPNVVCNAGSATLTTVLSMKAMPEARMVAASTQRPTASVQGAAAARESMAASSQGGFI